MYTHPEHVAAQHKAQIDTMLALACTAFNSAERLASLNLSTARSFLDESVNSARALLAAGDVKALADFQSAQAQPMIEKAVAYARSVYEIANQSQDEVSRLLEQQADDHSKQLTATLDKLAKSAPAGSEAAIATLKSTIAAANSAYDNVTRTVRKVADIAETNVNATTEAALQAVAAQAKNGAA